MYEVSKPRHRLGLSLSLESSKSSEEGRIERPERYVSVVSDECL